MKDYGTALGLSNTFSSVTPAHGNDLGLLLVWAGSTNTTTGAFMPWPVDSTAVTIFDNEITWYSNGGYGGAAAYKSGLTKGVQYSPGTVYFSSTKNLTEMSTTFNALIENATPN